MATTNSSHKQSFAVFDIDWTMHPSALGTNLIHELLVSGVITADFDIEKTYEQWQNSHDPGIIFMNHYHELFQKLLGLEESVLRKAGKKVALRAVANIYPFIQTELTRHKKEKRCLLLISNSPTITVEYFAQQLGFDDYSGGDFEFNEDGKLHAMYSTSARVKSDELQRLVLLHQLGFSDSYGYGDSADDISMLELVEHPIAISPREELKAESEKRGWEIVYVR